MTYTFLLFDLDHTLLDFDTAEEVALTQFLQDQEVQDIQAFKDYYKPMNQGLWKDLEQKKLTKQELVDSRFAIGLPTLGSRLMGLRWLFATKIHQSSGAVFPRCGGRYWLDLKKQVTSSMVQRTE